MTTVWTHETMTGFGDVMFRIGWDSGMGDAASMPGWERTALIVQNHIPASDITETDIMGFTPWSRQFTVQCENDIDWNALRRLELTEGVLRIPARMNDLIDDDWSEEVTDDIVYAVFQNVLLVSLVGTTNWTDGVKSATATFQKEQAYG